MIRNDTRANERKSQSRPLHSNCGIGSVHVRCSLLYMSKRSSLASVAPAMALHSHVFIRATAGELELGMGGQGASCSLPPICISQAQSITLDSSFRSWLTTSIVHSCFKPPAHVHTEVVFAGLAALHMTMRYVQVGGCSRHLMRHAYMPMKLHCNASI